mmetsp:Transcript_53696/g.117122  ORF Transcript_53696/g.117122 Transcript_53696/m.117122 type:complete len:218 (-) Transcript_53696:237-890(-)
MHREIGCCACTGRWDAVRAAVRKPEWDNISPPFPIPAPPVKRAFSSERDSGVGDACSLDHGELELSLKHLLSIDVRDALHLDEAEARLEGGELHLHHQRVARHHRPPPLDRVDAGEEEVALAVRDRLLQRNDPADLRHRLDLQDARHDRTRREVAVEKLLVRSHLLDPNSPLASLKLDHLVDEQEWIAVRQDLLYALDREHGLGLLERVGPLRCAVP